MVLEKSVLWALLSPPFDMEDGTKAAELGLRRSEGVNGRAVGFSCLVGDGVNSGL